MALSDQETSTVESVLTALTAGQVTLAVPGQPPIPATLTPGGGPDDNGPGLFPDRYAFPVPAGLTTATLTISPGNIDITGGVTTITTTLTPAAFAVTIPPPTAPPAPAGSAVRPRHYGTVGTAPTTPARRNVAARRPSTTGPAWTATVIVAVAAALVALAVILRARRRARPTSPATADWTAASPVYRPPAPTPASPPAPTSAPPASPTTPPATAVTTVTLPARPTRAPHAPFQPPTAPALAEGTAEAGLLGPVILAGWPGPEPPKATIVELLAFLASHPDRPWTTERLLDQINPGRSRPLKADTLRTYLTAARQILGADRVPESGRTGYTLTGIGTDWDRYQTLRNTDPAGALALIRGPVGAQPDRATSYDWLYTGPLPTRIETVVVADATDTARAALNAGDRALSSWAAHQGLLAVPLDTTLHAAALDAADDLPRAWERLNAAHRHANEPVPDTLIDRYHHLRQAHPYTD